MPNTITLKDEGRSFLKRGKASAAITPGHLIEFGGAADLQVHSTIGGAARRTFALENDLLGKGIDDAYAANDDVRYAVFPPGAEVYVRVAETVAKGDYLESAGDGTLQIASTPIEGSTVAVALAARTGAGLVAAEVF